MKRVGYLVAERLDPLHHARRKETVGAWLEATVDNNLTVVSSGRGT